MWVSMSPPSPVQMFSVYGTKTATHSTIGRSTNRFDDQFFGDIFSCIVFHCKENAWSALHIPQTLMCSRDLRVAVLKQKCTGDKADVLHFMLASRNTYHSVHETCPGDRWFTSHKFCMYRLQFGRRSSPTTTNPPPPPLPPQPYHHHNLDCTPNDFVRIHHMQSCLYTHIYVFQTHII